MNAEFDVTVHARIREHRVGARESVPHPDASPFHTTSDPGAEGRVALDPDRAFSHTNTNVIDCSHNPRDRPIRFHRSRLCQRRKQQQNDSEADSNPHAESMPDAGIEPGSIVLPISFAHMVRARYCLHPAAMQFQSNS
jgi:hypothetical protein